MMEYIFAISYNITQIFVTFVFTQWTMLPLHLQINQVQRAKKALHESRSNAQGSNAALLVWCSHSGCPPFLLNSIYFPEINAFPLDAPISRLQIRINLVIFHFHTWELLIYQHHKVSALIRSFKVNGYR